MTLAQLRKRFKSEGYELANKEIVEEITIEKYVRDSIEVEVKREQGKLLHIYVKNTGKKPVYEGNNLEKAKYWIRLLENKSVR